MRLDNVYGAEYRRQLPDVDSEKQSKREWGVDLKRYSREQINNGITWIKSQQDNFEDGWEFMNIGKCVGAIREANRAHAAHQLRLPEKRERPTSEEAEAGIAQLRGVMD